MPMTFPLQFHMNFSALVSIYASDGTVAVSHAGIEMGQGIHTRVSLVKLARVSNAKNCGAILKREQ